jgi:drug/metabolite transporter (DMT)-like permease
MTTQKLTARGWLAITITVMLWASGFSGIRAGLQSYSPAHLAVLRFISASLTMAIYAGFSRIRPPRVRDLPFILATGFVSITVYHLALNYGEMTVSAGAASMLVASAPIFAALLAKLFLYERLRIWGWLGILISFAGVSLIAMGEAGGLRFNRGAFFVLIAALATGVSVLLQKRYLETYTPTEFSAHLVWAGTLFLLLLFPGLPAAIRSAPLSPTLAIVYIGVFPGALAYITWGYVLARSRISPAASALYTVPAFAILIGWVWLREVPSWLSILGGGLAFAGVALVNTKGMEHKLPEAPVIT